MNLVLKFSRTKIFFGYIFKYSLAFENKINVENILKNPFKAEIKPKNLENEKKIIFKYMQICDQ
jgi:hypothetical protein